MSEQERRYARNNINVNGDNRDNKDKYNNNSKRSHNNDKNNHDHNVNDKTTKRKQPQYQH